jgi:hypothetical protein
LEKIVYFFEFIDDILYISPNPEYSLIKILFNFKSYDTKTNLITNLINERINLWLYKPQGLLLTNGIKGDPKLSYNPDTKTFNVSFSIKNDFPDSIGLISINLKKDKVIEINTAIPFGEVMPLYFVPPFASNLPLYDCENIGLFKGDAGYNNFYINFGSNVGTAGIEYDSKNVPDKFDIIWDGKTYTSGYVGSSTFDDQLLALGIPLSAIKTGQPSTGKGTLTFEKNKSFPGYALIRVYAPFGGTAWEILPKCISQQVQTPTPTPTKSPTPFSSPTPTQTRFFTPTPTPTPSTSTAPTLLRSIYVAFDYE